MAENESLDLMNRNSRRWFQLCQRIISGASDHDIIESLIGGVYKTVQRIRRQLPLSALLDAAIDGQNMAPLVQACDGHDYARLIELERRPSDNRNALLERVIYAMVDRFLHQMGMQAVGSRAVPNIANWRQRATVWKAASKARLCKLACQLASSPSGILHAPAKHATQQAAIERGFASVSVLGKRNSR